jgi:hypothetical protein
MRPALCPHIPRRDYGERRLKEASHIAALIEFCNGREVSKLLEYRTIGHEYQSMPESSSSTICKTTAL